MTIGFTTDKATAQLHTWLNIVQTRELQLVIKLAWNFNLHENDTFKA